MHIEKPFIHLFQTVSCYYMYDVNTNSIVRIDENTYNLLKDKSNLENIENNFGIQKLIDRGFLKPINIDIKMKHPLTDNVDTYLENNLNLLILQVTQNCNLRCKYCVYSGSYINRTHTNKRMNFETAKQAIDFYYQHNRNFDTPSISFYGGEPLLEFNLIKDIVSYCKSLFRGKTVKFNMTTNATLLNDEIMKFLQENNLNLTISLDGPKDIHDRGRVFADNNTGTFDKIIEKLNRFENLYPEYVANIGFNAVLDDKNNLKDSSDFFSFQFLKDATITFTNVSSRDVKEEKELNKEFYINYKYELFKMFLYCLGRLEKNDISKFMDSHINKLKNNVHQYLRKPFIFDNKCHPSGPCVPGMNRLFVTVDGEFYPCERVNENNQIFNIGNLKNGFNTEKISSLLNIAKHTEDKCRVCWAMGYCDSCAADMSEEDNLSSRKRLSRCAAIRYTTQELMKEYCTLKELGYSFDN